MRKGIAVSVFMAAGVLWAYPPPVEEAAGLSLTIVGLDQGPRPAKSDWDRRKMNVKVFDAAKDIPLVFALSNGQAKAVSGAFRVWMNEDWEVSGGEEKVTVGAGEVKKLTRTARAKPSVLPALYPVHATFAAPEVTLHPIAVVRAKSDHRAFVRVPRVREKIGLGRWQLDVGFTNTVSVTVGKKSWAFAADAPFDPVSRAGFAKRRLGKNFPGAEGRAGFVAHPPYQTGAGVVRADFPVELPSTAEGIRLTFALVLSDGGKAKNPGDGVTMRVAVKAAGEEAFREVFARHVPESGVALPGGADLSEYAGRRILLRLAVDPGPRNNTSFDQCAWVDPVIDAGRPYGPPDEATWRERERVAVEKAKAALSEGADAAQGRYVLSEAGRAFGAGVSYGAAGVLDAVFAFTDGHRALTLRGFEAEIDGERLTDLKTFPAVRVNIFAEGGALKVAWDTRAAKKALDGSPRFTFLAPGPASHVPRRVYGGTGCVWEGMERMRLYGSGFALSTRHAGADYDNGLSLVQAVDLPADCFEVDASNRLARLVTHNDAVFSFVPSDRGAFDAAFRFARVSGYKASAGIPAMKNRICIDDWSGPRHYLMQAEALRQAKKYGLDDVLYLQHNWQRWGYDARLPEVYPPRGDPAAFGEMVRAAKESGYLFGIHDNYVDYYPDAEDFSYRLFCYNEDGTPLEAWYNPGPRSLSYRWLPQAIHPRLKRNLALQRDGFGPTAIFIDVFTASGAKDVTDVTGRFHPHAENLAEWCRAWEECRAVYGVPDAVTVSEAASDSQIGFVDAGEADHFNPRHQAMTSVFADGERVPWHDAVSHTKMLLFGGGLGMRYSREKPGHEAGDTQRHGYGTDDYFATTVMGGRVPMGPSFCRATAKTYWMLHDVCGALGAAAFESFTFGDDNIHRLHSRFAGGGEVWVNRATNAVWRLPDGRLLPAYGFFAKTREAEACVELRQDVRVGWSRKGDVWFVDARPVGVNAGHTATVASKVVSAHVASNRVVRLKTVWDIDRPMDTVYRPFTHVVPEAAPRTIAFHGGGVNLTPADRVRVGRHEGEIGITVPPETPAGDYAVRYGFYDPHGPRLRISGKCDDECRVRGGTIRVERPASGPMKISWLVEGGSARDRELGLNTAHRMIDFGGLRTDGAFRFDLAKGEITPLPGSNDFKVELDLARLGWAGRRVKDVRPVEARGAADTVEWSQRGDTVSLEVNARAFAYRLVW